MKELRDYQKKAISECWQALIEGSNPVLLMASVGAGKSLILAHILLKMQKLGKNALCLIHNAELVRNNCQTFIDEGGNASIYCAALGKKEDSESVIFGTPKSILNGIYKDEIIAAIKFNIIIIDEAHSINYLNDNDCFMRILRHYKQKHRDMRVLGATGTNYRYRGASIVGDECLFKKQVGNITTEKLIQDGYLIKPNFQIDDNLVLDFSKVKVQKNGQFNSKKLEEVVFNSMRLTELICKQIVHIMEEQKRFGVFIFATTKRHAEEIYSHLPPEQSAIILGDTPQHERTIILNKSRIGVIRYLVNISIISVGVDIPAFDTIAYLRPTESLVLLVQTLGRVLRLSKNTGKNNSLVLDFAGNIERHRDWDNPILLDALKQTLDKDKPTPIICPRCNSNNTEHARRCVGLNEHDARCDYFFEFKECASCKTKNDIVTRYCRACRTELIDPNDKLELIGAAPKELDVIRATLNLKRVKNCFVITVIYFCTDAKGIKTTFVEKYVPSSEKAKNLFYGQFIKKHCENAHEWYRHISNSSKMEQMIKTARLPKKIILHYKSHKYSIKNKIFDDIEPL